MIAHGGWLSPSVRVRTPSSQALARQPVDWWAIVAGDQLLCFQGAKELADEKRTWREGRSMLMMRASVSVDWP